MEADLQTHVTFYLTGKRHGEQLDPIDGLALRPALLAGYRDLTRLRYDYPVVLCAQGDDGPFVRPLSGLIDAALGQATAGQEGERTRRQVLRLEEGVRKLVAAGAEGPLSALWEKAAAAMPADGQGLQSLARVRAAIKVDGELADCDRRLPARLIGHAWNAVQQRKSRRFAEDFTRLIHKLNDILKADFVHSDAGKGVDILRAGIGTTHQDSFDFGALSRILRDSVHEVALPASRRNRVTQLLAVLESQRFCARTDLPAGGEADEPYAFAFDSCDAALTAYRERLPKAIELLKAISMAELEIRSEYNEAKHDPIFEGFGEIGFDPRDLSRFPDYLVCVNANSMREAENDRLAEIFSGGLPMKVLVQTDDLLEESPLGKGHLAIGLRSKQLASMAIGLSRVFVLQCPSSHLVHWSGYLTQGLLYSGPALFSVFSGAPEKAGVLPAYLNAAAALEARVFPAFVYDPSAGTDWASRFHLGDNPQAERDWPVRGFAYEDRNHQRVAENLEFTLVDFIACDPRFAEHFARVPPARWNGSLVPVAEALAHEPVGLPTKVPCLTMVDEGNALQKVIVDENLIREARTCRDMWYSLRELGGIRNSHAERLLARERQAWERVQKQDGAAPDAVAAPVAEAQPTAPVESESERSPDEAYIETARCSTCNECTTLNPKMFKYDANMQAYIADINAGTYAQLVEAAENCQVSVIHPGKPRNSKEPGLEELLKRAEPFL
jgi:ferredoxin